MNKNSKLFLMSLKKGRFYFVSNPFAFFRKIMRLDTHFFIWIFLWPFFEKFRMRRKIPLSVVKSVKVARDYYSSMFRNDENKQKQNLQLQKSQKSRK